ncbi:hypothetical protein BT96DRAFT_660548 [Gymnopus androsaceus JB14]|uniref:DUF6535 domain-containing protein n=1 Tax=Gymnopus androsaceus JB14 TaxID=1447944 RepID=A0A6A4HQR8_9AGAR|nr:hypothetical protein BT96DRAFT_660548 [Gymnopus androsaceus JB14]
MPCSRDPSRAEAGLPASPQSESIPLTPLSPGIANPNNAEQRPASVAATHTVDQGAEIRSGTRGTTRRFPGQQRNPGVAPRNYKEKYPADERYKEMDPDARVWHVYNDEIEIFDTDMINDAGGSLDILLIFAGLFSSVLTTFVAQTSSALSPDSAAMSNSILLELVALQRAQANGTSLSSVPPADLSFVASRGDIWLNVLWFTSLVLSLSTALFAVLAKQWLSQYSSFVAGSPRERACIRHFRLTNFEEWRVQVIIGLLPTTLHLALFLFMVGLVIFLAPLNLALAWFLGVFAVVGSHLYCDYCPTCLRH